MNKTYKTARIISMRNTFVIVYTVLAALIFALTCVYFISLNTKQLLIQSESYTYAAAAQSQRNVENFCEDVERAQYIVFDEKECTEFYPTKINPSEDDLRIMNRITDILTKASYLGPYADIGIVYRNGLSAGVITDGLKDQMGSNLFQRSVSIMAGRDSCWTVLYPLNVSRGCYLKKINDNAVFIASFYVSKLSGTFIKMQENNNLVMYVTDNDDRIIYATENTSQSTGDRLPYELVERFSGMSNVTVGDSRGGATMTVLSNGWRMYSVVYPNKSGRFGMGVTESFILIVGLSMFILFIFCGFVISAFYTSERRAKKFVEDRTDSTTGLLTPFYFEEEASDFIETALLGSTWSFTKLHIKDQELIAERIGEEFIVDGLVKITKILRTTFGEEAVIGINEYKEFTVFADFTDFDIFKAHEELKARHDECMRAFNTLLVGQREDYKLNIAMGVCIYPDNGRDFDALDYKADVALKEALEKENDSIVYYDEKIRSVVDGK